MRHRVLICEDNDPVRRLIAAVLGARGGYDLREAKDGLAALDELARSRPDLVILDVHMPGIDGLAVLERVRSDPALAGTRVLLVTGVTEARNDDWGVGLGADAHLFKPFTNSALRDTVRSLLDG